MSRVDIPLTGVIDEGPSPAPTGPVMPPVTHHDCSATADEHIGELCFFSEIGALYAICRVESARERNEILEIQLELCAVANRSRAFHHVSIGQRIGVSCRREGWNQIWLLFPLGTQDLDEAMAGVRELRPSSEHWTWKVANPPAAD